jgi:hypothetical protein
VVAAADDLTGEAVCAFVVLKRSRPTGEEAKQIANELRNWVAKEIGPIAKPKDIRFGDNLPKTRSGKIMRRLLRSIAKGEDDHAGHHDAGESGDPGAAGGEAVGKPSSVVPRRRDPERRIELRAQRAAPTPWIPACAGRTGTQKSPPKRAFPLCAVDAYFCVNTQAASFFASASFTCALRRHGHRAPDAGAALHDLEGQLVDGVLLPGVLGRHVLVGGPTSFLSTAWQAMQFLAVASAWSAIAGAATAASAASANRARFMLGPRFRLGYSASTALYGVALTSSVR